MKIYVRLLSLVIGLLLLLACSSQGERETAVSPPDEAAPAQATESRPVDPNRLYAVTDLSLVANTGKPQFLNSFANW